MEIGKDDSAMLPPGDLDTLDKHEKEQFHAMQEDAVQHLMKASNDFQARFPGLRIEWRFAAEVYKTVQGKPGVVRYSGRRFY